jgi:hypothetical protein
MKRIVLIFSLLFVLFSCTKKENDSLFWEKSFGTGAAVSLELSADSGFLSCGEINNSPYFIKLDKSGDKVIDYTSAYNGLFGSLIQDSSAYYLGGNASGNMLITRIDSAGNLVWEKSISSPFKVFNTVLIRTSGAGFLGIGTANADSALNMTAGLMFVWFDTTGTINLQRQINPGQFISANDAVADNNGNLFLALTKKETGSGPKASVAKWSPTLQEYWETELYNNPEFSAASLGIERDNQSNVYVTGRTEVPSGSKPVLNSFIVSVDNAGRIKWKKYLENSNSGIEVIFNHDANLMMLNKNCFLINILKPVDGSSVNLIRTIDACDSNNTDSFGSDIIINTSNNIILSGSRGGSYYIAVKPAGE